ncbi:MAG: hypothetical protein RL217_133 [Pseudomonadota bacterium]|jgi:hypothetical protein
MENRAKNSWMLRTSIRQNGYNAAFCLLSLAMLWPYLAWFYWLTLLLLFSALLVWLARPQRTQLYLTAQGFYWQRAGKTVQNLPWRVGSVRRNDVIIWHYGFWPWQRLIIRPDSLAVGEFGELLRALALSAPQD